MNALPRPSRIRNAAFARWGLLVLALTLAASGQAVSGEDPPRVARPNLVLVLCDNLGYGDIEPFAAETVHRTPQLSRMASEGRRFTHFYASAGVCTPSRASIMTGCYAQRVGLHSLPDDGPVLRPVSPWGLHDAEVTLPEILREAGYATALIGKWHLGDQPEFLPVRHGFQSWFGIPYSEDMTRRSWKGRQWPPLPLMEGGQVVEAPADRTTLTQRYTDRAVRFIRQHRERPYFLMLSHAMPGSTPTPYASAAFQGKSRNGPWGDAVEELDWSTGKLLQAIRESTAERDTIVIWTSDNGAPTNGQDSRRGSNAPLRGRGYTTAEGGMRVPMLAWCPGRIPAGTTCDQLATTMDLLPTFAGLAGGQIPVDRTIDGHDVRALLFGDPGARSPCRAFFYYQGQQLQAVRSDRWKLELPLRNPVRHDEFRKGPAPMRLFDVVADAACEHDVVAQNPAVVSRLMALAEEAREDLGDLGRPGRGQRPAGHASSPTARVLRPVPDGH